MNTTEETHAIGKNLHNVGWYFVHTLWIQSQMIDLVILKQHPRIVSKFLSKISTLPPTFVQCRDVYWQKDFKFIKKIFEGEFNTVWSKNAKADLATAYNLRNIIAHAQVSLTRPYLLHRPDSLKRLHEIQSTLEIRKRAGYRRPLILKVNFSDDAIYHRNFSAIERLDRIHLKNIADSIGIPHSRVR